MNIENEKIGYITIALVSILGVVGVSMLDPIPQDLAYHLFSDRKTLFGIPNCCNVLSNLPFLVVGLMGLHSILRSRSVTLIAELKAAYILFFFGVSLVAFGSGYYHIWPDNASLVWDRLPMTIAFMALFSIITSEFVSVRAGRFMLWPLVVFGAFSVFYWQFTESRGEGDLRLYVLVQFLPMLVIPVMLLLFRSSFTRTSGYWWLLLAYVLAKVFEHFDAAIHQFLHVISGHSLKHIIAALGVLPLLSAYINREPLTGIQRSSPP